MSRHHGGTVPRAAGDKPCPVPGSRSLTSAQRIEAATTHKKQVVLPDVHGWDVEALFRKYDTEQTLLLSRGSLMDMMREVGLEHKLGDAFAATVRLAFDAHSADSHFLAFPEFKQLYYYISHAHPDLLPRSTKLQITLLGARELPSTDPNGKSDPFCTVTCCRTLPDGKLEAKHWAKSQTKVVEKTLTPWWGEDCTDKFGYTEGDDLLLQIFDWDIGDKSELMAKAILPNAEFNRPGGFHASLPMTCVISDAPKNLVPILKLRVVVKDLPNPPPRLQTIVHSVTGLPPLDSTGKLDCTCTFQIVDKPFSRSTTKVSAKTLDPVWNETFDGKHRFEDGDTLSFEVRTHPSKGKSEFLGRCTVPCDTYAKTAGFHGEVSLHDVPRAMYPNPEHPGGRYFPKLRLTIWLADMMPSRDQILEMKAAGIVNAATVLHLDEAPPGPTSLGPATSSPAQVLAPPTVSGAEPGLGPGGFLEGGAGGGGGDPMTPAAGLDSAGTMVAVA